jgi:hypothetical protein
VRIDTHARKCEFGHIGFADNCGARHAQSLDRRRIRCGWRGIFQYDGAGQGGFARDVEQVFHRDRQPCQRWGFNSCCAQRIRIGGGGACCFGIKAREDVRRSSRRFDRAVHQGAAGLPRKCGDWFGNEGVHKECAR